MLPPDTDGYYIPARSPKVPDFRADPLEFWIFAPKSGYIRSGQPHNWDAADTGTHPQAGGGEQGFLTNLTLFIGEENLSPKHIPLFPLLS